MRPIPPPLALTDLELLAELRGVALGVHPQQLLVGDGELVHQDGRLSAEAGLQDGVVDEDVLLLEGHTVTQSHSQGACTSARRARSAHRRAERAGVCVRVLIEF